MSRFIVLKKPVQLIELRKPSWFEFTIHRAIPGQASTLPVTLIGRLH